MTRSTPILACVAAVLTLLGSAGVAADAAGASRGAAPVTITVHYTGQGAVDERHRIWIWVFDTPDIGPGAMPILETSVSTNGGSTTLLDVGPDRVWIAVGYDQPGGSMGSAPPGSGWPIGIYAGADGRPAAISTRDPVEAEVRFDDSRRMP